MIGSEVVAVVLVGLCVAAYFERKSLKADVAQAKADVVDAGLKFLNALRAKESQVRAKIAADALKIADDVKAWEAKETVSAKDAITQFEARLKQIL